MPTPPHPPPGQPQATPSPRLRRRLEVALVALGLLLALGWLWPRSGPTVPGPEPAQAAVAALARPAAVVPAASAVSALGGKAVPASAPAEPRAEPECHVSEAPLAKLRAAVAALLPDTVASSALMARIEAESEKAALAGQAAHSAAVVALRDSPDPIRHAAGLMIMATPILQGTASCQGEDCAGAIKHLEQASVAPLAELATLARDTPLPQVYAWAWQACMAAQYKAWAPPACAHLSTQRWAQLAPDSPWPWLAQAAQAQQAGDVAGELGAMQRAATATQWRNESGGLVRLLLAAQVPGQSAQVRWQSEFQALLLNSQRLGAGMGGLGKHCMRQLDANRQQTCSLIAERLLAQPDDLLQLAFGISVAERSGWPAARVAALRREREQLTAQAADLGPLLRTLEPDAATACAGMAQMHQHFVRVAEVGELAALRERLVASRSAASAPGR